MTGISCVLHASELLHYHSYPKVTFSNVETPYQHTKIRTHTQTRPHTHTHVRTQAHAHTHTYTHARTHAQRLHLNPHLTTDACLHSRLHGHARTHEKMYTYARSYTHVVFLYSACAWSSKVSSSQSAQTAVAIMSRFTTEKTPRLD